MHLRTIACLAWLLIIILAGALRLNDLGERPVHADEATGARILAERLEGGDYQFDPKHFHGPLLGLLTEPLARLRGESTWPELSIETLRLSPIIAGMLMVLTPLLWRRQFGDFGACLSGALLASSPLMVYYNRMFIHESWLVLFGMLGLAFAFRLFTQPNYKNALLCGISVGCMFATKETFIITVSAWALALAACYALTHFRRIDRPGAEAHSIQSYPKPACLALLSAVLVAAFFYSNGFRFPERILDAYRTYLVYETTLGHDKPASYYLSLLLWPKHLLGQWWSEGSILLLVGLACVAAVRIRSTQLAIIFLGLSALAQFAIYSSIAYKTPWLMLLPWAHVCLMAGFCVKVLQPSNRVTQGLLGVGILAALLFQTQQSLLASQRWANDARAPYVYVPSSRDLQTLESWLPQLTESLPEFSEQPIVVIGRGYWPLPWYLRSFDQIGYWDEPDASMTVAPLVFSMEASGLATDLVLSGSHTAFPRGLRTNVSMTLYMRNDLWAQWIDQKP